MGEKETATDQEVERLKNKTKSNQSNDRTEAGDGDWTDDDGTPAGEAALIKTKTKSNQSNDRLDQGGGDDPTDDNTDDDETPEARINNTKSNIKNRGDETAGGIAGNEGDTDERRDGPRSADQGFRAGAGGGGGEAGIAVSDEGVPADKPKSK